MVEWFGTPKTGIIIYVPPGSGYSTAAKILEKRGDEYVAVYKYMGVEHKILTELPEATIGDIIREFTGYEASEHFEYKGKSDDLWDMVEWWSSRKPSEGMAIGYNKAIYWASILKQLGKGAVQHDPLIGKPKVKVVPLRIGDFGGGSGYLYKEDDSTWYVMGKDRRISKYPKYAWRIIYE